VVSRTAQSHLAGFWLLITLLVLSRGPVHAEWVAVKKHYQVPGRETVYFDPDTIRREEHRVTLWQLTDIKWMEGALTPRLLSIKTHKQFDCMNNRLRVLAVTEFSRQMGTGKQADGYIENGNWLPVEPGSVNQASGLQQAVSVQYRSDPCPAHDALPLKEATISDTRAREPTAFWLDCQQQSVRSSTSHAVGLTVSVATFGQSFPLTRLR